MNEFDFLLPLDIDEIIIPTKAEDKTWKDLLISQWAKGNGKGKSAAYVASNVLFLLNNNHENELQPAIPENLLFLHHVYLAANFTSHKLVRSHFRIPIKLSQCTITTQLNAMVDCTAIEKGSIKTSGNSNTTDEDVRDMRRKNATIIRATRCEMSRCGSTRLRF